MKFKVVQCPRCGWVQITTAKVLKCRKCNHSSKKFRIYAEFDEAWKATIFIQRLKEYIEQRKQDA